MIDIENYVKLKNSNFKRNYNVTIQHTIYYHGDEHELRLYHEDKYLSILISNIFIVFNGTELVLDRMLEQGLRNLGIYQILKMKEFKKELGKILNE